VGAHDELVLLALVEDFYRGVAVTQLCSKILINVLLVDFAAALDYALLLVLVACFVVY
jgi:hypothetical protein